MGWSRRRRLIAGNVDISNWIRSITVKNTYLELREGVIVEVGSPGAQREEMHSAALERVDATLETVGDVMERLVKPLIKSFADMKQALDVPIEVKEAELEVGLSFSAEGNIFITKATAEGSLKIKVTFSAVKPPGSPQLQQ
jgi:hypothetical protein